MLGDFRSESFGRGYLRSFQRFGKTFQRGSFNCHSFPIEGSVIMSCYKNSEVCSVPWRVSRAFGIRMSQNPSGGAKGSFYINERLRTFENDKHYTVTERALLNLF